MSEPEAIRPHGDRRHHQRLLEKQRQRRRRRRQARVRRLRLFRGIRTAKFWSQFTTFMMGLLLVTFWAKFAVVYNIPDYAKRGPLVGVQAYVAVKPWWFGPPMFDVEGYAWPPEQGLSLEDPYQYLLQSLGRYQGVLLQPVFVWIQRR